jgi:hypothetical protein
MPSPADLEQIVRLREGALREVPFPLLLHALSVAERTLVLELRRKNLHKRIVIEDGVPVDCRSNLVHETFGRFLVLQGRIDEDQFQSTFSESVNRGIPQGEVLSERGIIQPVELFKLLQQNLAKKLLDGFSWRDGTFRMLFDVPDVDSPLKVRVPQLVVTGISRFSQQEEVDAAIAPLVGKILVLHPQPRTALDEIRLGPSQSILTASLATGRRIDELAALPGLGFEEVGRLIYALFTLGLVLPQDQVKALGLVPKAATKPSQRSGPPLTGEHPLPTTAAFPVPPKPAPDPPPVVTLPAAPAAVPPSALPPAAAVEARSAAPTAAPTPPSLDAMAAERRRNEVMQSYLAHRRQDPFELLALTEDASLTTITARYLQVARSFAWWTWPAELAAVADKAQELFVAAAKAFGTLSDTEQRNTLIYRRKTLREERNRRPPPDFAIKTDLLDSELQFRRGMLLVEEKRYKEAIQLLEFAADCDPQNGRYRAEAARCKFLASPLGGGRQAIQDLREAVRVDPGCGLAHFYAGEIHRELGNLDDAEVSLQKAIKLMAPDRRPIEALRTLRLKKK